MRFTRRTFWTMAIAGFAAVVALGGARWWAPRAPDLRRLYASGMERAAVPPVIIIPGILGSRLRERGSGREIWPGSLYNVLFSARSLGVMAPHCAWACVCLAFLTRKAAITR